MIAAFVLIASVSIGGVELTPLQDAIWQVETGRCEGDCPPGDGGKAMGPLQIHRVAWLDVRRDGEAYEDCEGLAYSLVVMARYFERYAVERRLGHTPTDEDRARIWNGGPNGYKKRATVGYWSRVERVMKEARP